MQPPRLGALSQHTAGHTAHLKALPCRNRELTVKRPGPIREWTASTGPSALLRKEVVHNCMAVLLARAQHHCSSRGAGSRAHTQCVTAGAGTVEREPPSAARPATSCATAAAPDAAAQHGCKLTEPAAPNWLLPAATAPQGASLTTTSKLQPPAVCAPPCRLPIKYYSPLLNTHADLTSVAPKLHLTGSWVC